MEASIPVIVIAHEAVEQARILSQLLEQSGFQAIQASAAQALTVCQSNGAGVVVLSVGISDPMCFELIESIQNGEGSHDCKTLLIGSVHNQEAYRRDPSETYGADDFIDETSVEAELCERVARLLDPAKAFREDPQYARFRAIADVIVAEMALQYPRELVLPEEARSERWTGALRASRRRLRMTLAGTDDLDVDWIGQALQRLAESLRQS